VCVLGGGAGKAAVVATAACVWGTITGLMLQNMQRAPSIQYTQAVTPPPLGKGVRKGMGHRARGE
jgi:hypothetical protein